MRKKLSAAFSIIIPLALILSGCAAATQPESPETPAAQVEESPSEEYECDAECLAVADAFKLSTPLTELSKDGINARIFQVYLPAARAEFEALETLDDADLIEAGDLACRAMYEQGTATAAILAVKTTAPEAAQPYTAEIVAAAATLLCTEHEQLITVENIQNERNDY